MRRLATLVALAAALVAFAALALPRSGADAADVYRVDAVFDTSKGIIPGQVVKIAGARVGEVTDVSLTSDYKARIHMEIEQRFAPFKRDAFCDIQPEGLISENFVQCEPGRAQERLADAKEGEKVPLVPVEQTEVPINLSDLFQAFRTPTRQRFSVIVASLGAGVAARGSDFNAVLRRANPTLKLVRDTVSRLEAQKRDILAIVDSTDQLAGELAKRPERLQDLIEQAAAVTSRVADERAPLQQAIRRLPPLLDAAEPALARLDELADDGTPVLRDLRATAPALTRLLRDVRPFAANARPALRRLGGLYAPTKRAIASARPVVRQLRAFATDALPAGKALNALFLSLEDQHVIENLLTFTYNLTSSLARYDASGHMLPAYLLLNECSLMATQAPSAGCDIRYNKTGTAAATDLREAKPRKRADEREAKPRQPEPSATTPAPSASATPAPSATPGTPQLDLDLPGALDQLVDGITKPLLGDGGLLDPKGGGGQLQDVLDLLIGE